ncbi:zinc-binding dehydrogenase [Alkalicoccus halolimnae]|uniref:Zinc-binding dehydrogenase n=1 Tax=Alkalicoccus halolimnae TaxID=1667239 RepID=A0A5C7F073_9BACI|nr:zinc-binding dehydrogenase [Alkalicoccus halolimnae]TXF82517.1 zinc-binding dehydrogenase [Alkalicoccus halolimnae]
MKAMLLNSAGSWRDMKIEEVEKPKPKEGEMLVRIKAAGLNPVDYKSGENGIPTWKYPHILGLDAAGTVEETGPGVDRFSIGDHVVFLNDMTEWGAFAEFAVTKAFAASKLPYNVLFQDAAALPVAGYTAYQALFHKLRVKEGESILIHAGAGGVGGFAIQLAKQAGLKIFTTARKENHDYVKKLGADVAVDYTAESFVERIQEETGGIGVNYVLDTVGSDNATKSLDILAYNGHIAFIAGAPKMDEFIDFSHPVSFHHVALGSVYQSRNVKEQMKIAEIGNHMLDLLSDGKLEAMVSQKIPSVDIPQGLEQLETRRVRGKIISEW